MERWSYRHNTYKFFNLGRPPSWGIIEKSDTLKNRITKMKRIKTYCEKNKITDLDLSGFSENEIDDEINKILSNISENGELTNRDK